MKALICIGVKADGSLVNLYTGLVGVDLENAGQKAAEAKEYVQIHRISHPQSAPMPIDPRPTKTTTPTFVRPKAVAPKVTQNKNHLDEAAEQLRKQREERLKTNPPTLNTGDKKSGSEDKQEEQKNTLRTDGPTFEEHVANNGDPAKYPPEGFAEKDSEGLRLYRNPAPAVEENKETNKTEETATTEDAAATQGDSKYKAASPKNKKK